MLDYEVYVLTCYGCDEKLTLRAGQPSEVQHCPKCEMELVIDWRPEGRSGAQTAQGATFEKCDQFVESRKNVELHTLSLASNRHCRRTARTDEHSEAK